MRIANGELRAIRYQQTAAVILLRDAVSLRLLATPRHGDPVMTESEVA